MSANQPLAGRPGHAARCGECGWTGRPGGYDSAAIADYALRRHSCAKTRRAHEAHRRWLERDAAVDRTPQPCRHKNASHEHGSYVTAKLDGCRCLPCSAATSEYNAARVRAQAYGRWAPYVDARPAAAHLRALSAAGMGWKRAAAAAGVPESSVYPLLYGRPDRNGGAPRTKARPATVEAILSVPMPTVDALAGGAVIESTGTRRRLQSLVFLGWSVQRLADRAGIDRQALDGALVAGRPVQARTARAVRDLFEELWDQAPPEGDHRERIAASRARGRARAAGWAPPLAWDDETIDDSSAQPAEWDAPGPRDVGLGEWLMLVQSGEDPVRAARRVGVTLSAIEKRASRDRNAAALALAARFGRRGRGAA